MIGVIKSLEQPLKLWLYQLLMISSSWWSSEPLMTSASGEQLLKRCFWWRQLLQDLLSSELVVFRNSFLQMLQASFLLIPLLSFVLQNLCLNLKILIFLSMVLHTWTNISISNWQFFCHHQNSKGNVKHILFQQIQPQNNNAIGFKKLTCLCGWNWLWMAWNGWKSHLGEPKT